MDEWFTEEQVRRIFARAAQRQHAARTPDGLTRADLEAVALEVGLDPALVAAEIEAEAVDLEVETWRGVPATVTRSRLLPARISDAEWERVVDLLRDEFKTPGVAQQVGARREWSTPSGHEPFEVRVEAREGGDLVTISRPNATRTTAIVTASAFGMIAVMMTVLTIASVGDGLGLTGRIVMAAAFYLLAIGAYGATWLGARHRANHMPARFDAVLDRIDLLSRADGDRPRATTPAQPTAESAQPGRLGLDALDGDLEDEPARPRGRTRA